MTRPVRFLHAADFHLGAQFIAAHQRDLALGQQLRSAVRAAYDNVISAAIDNEVDFVCFAGDLFNAIDCDYPSQSAFIAGLKRLDETGIEAYFVAGNHDALDASDRLALPGNAHLMRSDIVERITFEKDGVQPCTIYGRSYPTQFVDTNFAQGFKREKNDVNAIGILHTNVGTESTGENYARASMNDLINAKMDYWALGHIHLTQVLHENNPCVIYAGSPQGLTINETGKHGCYLVTLDRGSAHYEWIKTSLIEMVQVSVDISSAESLEDIRALVSQRLEDVLEHEANYVVRLTLLGTSHLEDGLAGETMTRLLDSLIAELAVRLPRIKLDSSIINETRDSVEDSMAQTSNEFLRAIFDTSAEEARELFDVDKAFYKNRASLLDNNKEIRSALLSEDEFERTLTEAKELLYRALMKEGE